MGFWILALGAALVAVVVIGYAMIAKRGSGTAESAAYDMQVYRDQLKELDREAARGVIAPADAERARVEISRRLLEADRQLKSGPTADAAPRAATYGAIAVTFALIVGGGGWLYYDLGAPGYWDMPLKGRIAAAVEARDNRMSQAEAEAEAPVWDGPPPDAPADYVDLVERLRAAVASRPDDLQGQSLLVTHETALANYRAAHAAKARAIALMGDEATGEDYAQYADLMIMAAEGYVSPEAEQALTAALERDPQNPVARYYSGLLFAQTGRPDLAFRMWRDLLETSDPEAPWVAPIRGQIMQLAALAGVDYRLPDAPAGPSAEDIEAAADMTPEERAAMIGAMVDGLMQRLATEGGSAEDWARLIRALGVQGDLDRARTIFAEAQAVFQDRPEELALVTAAATEAGLTGEAPAPALERPSANDIEAAGRAARLDGLATRLSDELATAGGPPEKWAELIDTLAAMDEPARAASVWREAQQALAGDDAALAIVRRAAVDAGLVTE
ncbi:c-type cytochrome biogenesis protein CcmI [Maritimibacter fusiformis]|uniref:C-type cytochrome biogenesis protein CcmI n=1 Tax=Maritimibacter fusiformis TaxID=2603819 RepID=A0A5D0RNS5_9RHOB|nr:c-type cytochrome biogenesis protein CcmI [Maritimibacter fusiformis]TYB82809.1 c-type cytochrome biogenesis protein CcmI [Maritimibacter fusiformis]